MWSSSLWKCSVLATLWIIWLERNGIYGDSSEEDVNSLWNRARFLAYLWASKEFQDTFVFFFRTFKLGRSFRSASFCLLGRFQMLILFQSFQARNFLFGGYSYLQILKLFLELVDIFFASFKILYIQSIQLFSQKKMWSFFLNLKYLLFILEPSVLVTLSVSCVITLES